MKSKACIVLIDDDEPLLAAASRYLSARGFVVHTSTSALGMTKLIREVEPDAVVIDMVMPALDGSRFAALLRHHVGKQLPIVLWSGGDAVELSKVAASLLNATSVSKTGGAAELHRELAYVLAESVKGRATASMGAATRTRTDRER